MNPQAERGLRVQINFLMREYRNKRITMHQLMSLIDMAYRDYLDFHPEDRPGYGEHRKQSCDTTDRK